MEPFSSTVTLPHAVSANCSSDERVSERGKSHRGNNSQSCTRMRAVTALTLSEACLHREYIGWFLHVDHMGHELKSNPASHTEVQLTRLMTNRSESKVSILEYTAPTASQSLVEDIFKYV